MQQKKQLLVAPAFQVNFIFYGMISIFIVAAAIASPTNILMALRLPNVSNVLWDLFRRCLLPVRVVSNVLQGSMTVKVHVEVVQRDTQEEMLMR